MGSRLGSRFFRFWFAGAATNLADGVATAAFPLLVATLTRDPFAVAAVTFTYRLPWLVFEVFAGEIVDRSDRRTLMVWGNGVRAAIAAALAGLVAFDQVTLAVVYVAAFGLGLAETLVDTAWDALVPSLVRRDKLEVANGWNEAAESTANDMLGPVAGGFLFGLAAGAPFAADALIFAVGALVVLTTPGGPRRVRAVRRESSLRQDIWEGLRWILTHRVMRTVSFAGGVANLLGAAQLSIFVLLAQERLGVDDVGFGLVLAAAGVGGIAGSAMAGPVERAIGPGRTLFVAAATNALVALALAVTSSVWIAGGALALFGFAVGTWNVVVVSLRQELTPDELRGRVTADARVVTYGAIPLGALLGGLIAETAGIRAPYALAAAIGAAMAAVLWRAAPNETINALRSEVK